MSSGELQFLSWYWLGMLPLLWIYLMIWFGRTHSGIAPSIADVDIDAHNHFYHPLVRKFVNETNNNTQEITQKSWKNPSFWWQATALSLLIIALAHPVLMGERLPDPPPERDIIFIVDTSVSMQLKDYELQGQAISRMDLLRNLLDTFAAKISGERVAVIIFAEEPYMLVPLSNDQGLIRSMLRRVTTTLAGRYSALGDALLLALKEAQKQPDRHQTFILFSDADVSRGKVTPAAAAELIAENRIPVFTVAIGSSQQDADKEIGGGLYQPVNLPLLEEIASRTDGESYQVNNSKALQNALQSILNQRQNLAIAEPQYEQQTLYVYPLLTGLMMLMLLQIWRLYRGSITGQGRELMNHE